MLDDTDDPEDRATFSESDGNRRYGPSISVQRASAAALHGVGILRWKMMTGVKSPRHLNAMRAHIKQTDLSPSRLYRLYSTAYNLAAQDRVAPDEQPMQGIACPLGSSSPVTIGNHRDGAWLVARAAFSLLLETFQPTEYRDLMALAAGVISMAQSGVTFDCGGNIREQIRARKRLRLNFANALSALPLDYGMQTTAAKARHEAEIGSRTQRRATKRKDASPKRKSVTRLSGAHAPAH